LTEGDALFAEIDETSEYTLDLVLGSAAKGRHVKSIVSIHADDAPNTADQEFKDIVLKGFNKDFQVGHIGINDVMLCGQLVRWVDKDCPNAHILGDQEPKVEEL
jgi:hypothetical protein